MFLNYTFVWIYAQKWNCQIKWKLYFQFVKETPYCFPGFPCGASGKEPTCQLRRHKRCGFDPWVRKRTWRRAWQPTPVFLPIESHGQRILVGYSQQDSKELGMTEATEHAPQHILFSMVVAPIYIPNNNIGGFPFLFTLSRICYLWIF